ncbi:hypothetical protein L3V82_11860 [Thiotrichales bacterium 19S3-7]|nr:hypothetical protein [Thiotrichales bacterium 19S3-7]MCF6802909.1 hypothetical protein [Thiotrichales bacterium 19S3-11]
MGGAIAADGHTYEKEAILEWFKKSDKSPMTLEKLNNKTLIDNHSMKSMIGQWQSNLAKSDVSISC